MDKPSFGIMSEGGFRIMSDILFSKLIKCDYCGKNHKAKLARKKRIYVCSTWSNYGKEHCKQNKVEQDLLMELLELRYNEILTKEEIIEKIDKISISENKVEINVNDGEPIVLTNTLGSF